MNLKKLINKSYYSSIGYISSEKDLEILETYIKYNLPVLNEFKNHIIVTNYDGDFNEQNKNLWEKYLPNCILIDLPENRGHSFGIADQENAIIDYCHKNNIDWICKTSHDVIFKKEILEIKIDGGKDFYFMQGIGYGGMKRDDFDIEKIIKDYFMPQTNFYFIDTSKIDYLYEKDYIDSTYYYIQNLEFYSGRVWEYIEGWTCERFLKSCVIRNNLSKYDLVPEDTYRTLLDVIIRFKVDDCSHKNIMIEGICHNHNPFDQVLDINKYKKIHG